MPTRGDLTAFWRRIGDTYTTFPMPPGLTLTVPEAGHFMSLKFDEVRGYQYQWIYHANPPLLRAGLVFHVPREPALNRGRAGMIAGLFEREIMKGVAHVDTSTNNVTVMFYLPCLGKQLPAEMAPYAARVMQLFIERTFEHLP